MKDFKINDFLSLRLEDGKTNIYLNGEQFNQSKYLIINIFTEETEIIDEVESIDEVVSILGWRDGGQEGVKYNIDPETEFWGHCSNLQVWFENDYDTRLLHSNLAFPLLKKLVEFGDPLAKKVFKGEIVKRFKSGYPTVLTYILEKELLNYLNREELSHLIEKNLFTFLENIDKLSFQFRSRIESRFLVFLENTINFLEDEKEPAYPKIQEIANITGLIKEHFPTFLKVIDTINYYDKYGPFSELLKIAEETGMLEEQFTAFWEIMDKFPDGHKYHAFSDLIKAIKNTNMLSKYYSRIETQFIALMDTLDKQVDQDKYRAFSKLFEEVKDSKLKESQVGEKKSIPLDRKNFGIWSNRGYWSLRFGYFEYSVVAFKKAIEIYPNFKDHYIMLTQAYIQLERYDEALDTLLKTFTIQEDPKRINKVRKTFNFGHNAPFSNYDIRMMNSLTPNLNIDPYRKLFNYYYPNKKTLWKLKGTLHAIKGEHDKAISAFSYYLEKKPKDKGSWISLALTYMKNNDFEQAIKTCNDALAKNSKFREIKLIIAYIYIKQSEHDKVIEFCQKVLETDSSFQGMGYVLSLFYLGLKQYEKALLVIENAIRIYPNFYAGIELKGIILLKMKEYDKVLPLFDLIIYREPHKYRHWYNLALFYWKTGKYDDGLNACSKCLKLYSEFEACQLLRSRLYQCISSGKQIDEDIHEEYMIIDILHKMLLRIPKAIPAQFHSEAEIYSLIIRKKLN